jgi:hypothetical protein
MEVSSSEGDDFKFLRTGLGGELEIFNSFSEYYTVRRQSRIPVYAIIVYEVVSQNSRTVIVATASVKEDERGGQGHISASLLQQSAK